MSFSETEQQEFSLRKGDVLICEGGEVGRSSVVERDLPGVYFQKAIHRVRCSPKLDPHFLFRYMEFAAPTGRLDDFSSEATIKHLTGVKLRRLPIPLPPIEEQRRIAAVLDATDALRAKRRQAIAKLDTLTQAIFIDMFGDLANNSRRWPIRRIGDLV
ncbi:restriction endonuclease subunit S [Ilumatobacter sp.]|uniref:restriction endonuclease subunit S n=1 Tax=Ilumatobacter sp. TaxID=1967498 RepID=UPI0037521850